MISQLSARSARLRQPFCAAPRLAGGLARSTALLAVVPIRALLAVILLAVGGGLGMGHAQATAHFDGIITTLGGGFYEVAGVAVDGSGNVYVADLGNNAVKEIPTGCVSATCLTTLGGGFYHPFGVVVDSSGNVYVADSGNNAVKEIPTGCVSASCVTTLGGGFYFPASVAVDGSGNVYVADFENNAVKEIPTGCVSASCVTTLGGSFRPAGVAVDGSGNVYVGDYGNNAVKEMPTGCVSASCVTTLGGGFHAPNGVAVDGNGNVYVADYGNNAVKEMPTGCVSASCVTTLGGGFSHPEGVAVDGSGNIYAADTANNAVKEIKLHSVNLQTFAVGATSPAQTLTFVVDSAGTLSTPLVLTQGTPNLDFKDAGTGTCTTNGAAYAYNAGDTCTVDVVFSPMSAGTRNGAVVLTDATSTPIETVYLYGTGTGPQIAFSPATETTLVGRGLTFPFAAAVDGGGNIYIADSANSRVLKETVSGGNYTQTTVGSGLNTPYGVVVDGSGNVYVADSGNSRVLVEKPSGGGYTQTAIGGGLSSPNAVAVDAAGNIYIADTGNDRVLKETLIWGSYVQSTVASGLNSPHGVTVDGNNVYIADTSNNRVLLETLAGGSYTQTIIANGLSSPNGVAVDGSGNVYIADSGSNTVFKETPAGGSYTLTIVANGLSNPQGVAVDGSGNVYIADTFNNRVLEENVATPPTLTFAATPFGQTSSDSPQSIQVANIGNQALNAVPPGLSIGANFAQVAGSGTPEDCTANFSLTPGTACNLSISFTPESIGQISSSAILTDNNLNATPSAMQTIPLAGTGNAATPSISFSVPNQTYGAAPFSVAATSNSTSAITYSVVSGPATISGSTVTLTGAGSVTLMASQAAAGNYAAGSANATFTVAAAAPSISFAVGNQTYGAIPFAVAATSNSTGAISYSVVSGPATISGSTVSLTGAGSVVLQASQAAGGNYTAGSTSATFTVAAVAPSISFAVGSQTYGSAPFAVAATSSSTGTITYSVVSGPATINGSTVTLTGAGSVTLMAIQTAAGNYTAGSANATFTVAAAAPSISFTVGNQTYGAAPFAVAATSSSTGAITYSVVSGPATISGSTVTLTGVGTVTLQASEVAAGNYTAGSANATFTVAAAVPSISFGVGNQTYGAAPFAVVATSSSAGAITYSVVSGPATISGSTVTLTGAGSVTLMASQAAAGNYTATSTNATFTVAAAAPSISFAVGNQTYGAIPFAVAATSNSTGTITYSVVSGPATISSNTVTLTGAGSVTLMASQAAAGNYTAASTNATFPVAAGAPSISFAVGNQTYGAAPFAVVATSSSAGAITYSVVSGPATISGSTVTLTGAGSVTLMASQAAAGNYTAASTNATFTVAATAPAVSFVVGNQTYGAAPFAVAATSSSTGAITYSVVSGPATISGSTVTLTGVGTVTLQASEVAAGNYTAASANATFTVAAAVPSISFGVGNQTYGAAPFAVAATSSSTGAITYSVVSGPATISGNTVTLTGTGSVTLQASQASAGNYTATSTNATFTVAAAAPSISFAVGNQTFGAAPFAVAATSSSTGTITYSVVSGPATISGSTVTLTGAGSVTLQASQAAIGNYTATSTNATFTVAPAAPSINFSVGNQIYGAAPFAVAATSSSTGTITYSVVSGPATISGSTVSLTGAGSITLMASQAAAGNYTAASTNATFTVAPAAPSINFSVGNQIYGAAPFAVAATSSSTGAITYSVVSGPATISGSTVTLTGAGSVTLMASQAAAGNYIAVSTNATFTVAAASPSISFVVRNQTYGAAPFAVAATSSSTGTITYSVVSGPATISGSTVTLTGAGSITLMASQAAAGNYTAASTNATFTVAPAAPSINFSVGYQIYGAAPFAVAATSSSTGVITYSVVSGPATISGSTVTLTGAGSVTLQAIQTAAGNYTAGTSNATFAVAKAGSTVSLGGVLNTTGNTATLTATVGFATQIASGLSGPTGMVTFSNASGTIGTATLVNGVATLTTPAYTGSQSFTATFTGDSNFTSSTALKPVALNFTVNPTLTFTIPGSYVYGQSFSVKAMSNSSGAITYSLVSGPATVSGAGAITLTGEGIVTVLASQATAPGYNMYSQSASFTATQATSTTKLTAGAIKSGYGTAATLTMKVSPQYAGTPSGQVTFYDGQIKLAAISLSSGAATYTTPPLVGTSHSFSATYAGDTNFTGSSSNTAVLTIPVTSVSLQLLCTQLVYPEPPAFVVKLGMGASPAPTGTVIIYDGTTIVATYPLYAVTQGYLLGLVLPPLNVGTHVLEAVYSGDATHSPGQSAIATVTVTPAPVKLSLSCPSNKLTLGQTLTCTLNANEGPLPVTGTVSYTITGWGSGSATLNKSGQATITFLEPNKGSFTLNATYAAQSNYQAAQPVTVTFTVN